MQDGVHNKRMKMNKSSRSQIFRIGLYLLFWLMLWLIAKPEISYARAEIISLMQEQQVPQQFVSLVVKKDICTLLDYCLVTPATDVKRPFFAPVSPAQTKMRLAQDELLRRHIDRFRELILVFHRLSISERSPLRYQINQDDLSNNFKIAIEIETSASPLATTISPHLADKDLIISFTLTIKWFQEKWQIIHLSKARFHPKSS